MSIVKFTEINPKTIVSEVIEKIEEKTGSKLSEGDERRLFVEGLSSVLVAISNDINYTGNMNLLRNSSGDYLTQLAKNIYSTDRLGAEKSKCPGMITLSEIQVEDVIIPKGTKITPDGKLMFCLDDDVTIQTGQQSSPCTLIAVEAGSKYNGFLPGKIKNIVDPVPYVESIVNTETSKEGCDEEDDDSLIERCQLSPEGYSTCGPDGAYKYFALSVSNAIADALPYSPSPGVVKILIILEGGEKPSQELLDKVLLKCSSKTKRPLTDNVQAAAPEEVEYDINLTYYLDKNFESEITKWRKNIEGEDLDCSSGAIREYIKWQQENIGRPISPDELRHKILSSSTYKVDNRDVSGVRRIELSSPSYEIIGKYNIAKAKNITVTYGGIE